MSAYELSLWKAWMKQRHSREMKAREDAEREAKKNSKKDRKR